MNIYSEVKEYITKNLLNLQLTNDDGMKLNDVFYSYIIICKIFMNIYNNFFYRS